MRPAAGFELEEVPEAELVPGAGDPPSFGYMDSHHLKPWRLRLNSAGEAALDEALAGRSEYIVGSTPRRSRSSS